MAQPARQHPHVADRRGAGRGARTGRPDQARRGRGHLPAAEQAAAPLLRGEHGAARNGGGVPRPADPARAVHHRGGGQRRRRQVHHRPAAPDAGHPVAAAPAHRTGHDRQLPVPQCGAGTARPQRPQGLPRVLRPPGPAALRPAGEGGRARGHRPGLLAPGLRHPARAAAVRSAARRADPRGDQRAAARSARCARAGRLLRLLHLRRRAHRRYPALVPQPAARAAGYRVHRPEVTVPQAHRR